jgi:hypothetical protein
MYLQNASEVKSLVNSKWWNASGNYFYAYLDNKRQFQGRGGSDLLYRGVTDEGSHMQSALNALLEKARTEPASAVEPKSHYAEILYGYGDPEAAYTQMMDLTRAGRERREYPEVSYSVIGALVNGMMGINMKPAAPIEDVVDGSHFETVIETLPQLTAKTSWVEIRNLPVLDDLITVKEESRSTVLTNRGKSGLVWQAAFAGSFPSLTVNGKPQAAQSEIRYLGHPVTWVRLRVAAGASAEVVLPVK